MKVLVTGGAGLIGSHLVERLVKEGHEITVMDDFSEGKEENLDNVIDDIGVIKNDISLASSLIMGYSPDIVYHLAAKHSVPDSFNHPNHYYINNIIGTQNIVSLFKNSRIVNISSSSAYSAKSPYGISKLATEHVVKLAKNSCSLRLFNVFGERQANNGALVPRTCLDILDGKQPTINGSGLQRRDFTYVEDVVDEIMQYGEGDYCRFRDVYGIGYGHNVTVDSVVKSITKNLNSDLVPVYVDERVGDVQQSEGSRSCLATVGFEKGLKLTCKWYDKHHYDF